MSDETVVKEKGHQVPVKLTEAEKTSLIIWSARHGYRGNMGLAILAAAKRGAPEMFSQT